MKKIINKILKILGIIIIVVLIPLLIINISLMVNNYTNPGDIPNFLGYSPLIVLSDSMNPTIKSNDLIISQKIDSNEIKENDIISFFDNSMNGNIVTHRVVEIVDEDNEIYFRTKGDANNAEDQNLVDADNVVGIYKFKISGVGKFILFLQTFPGLLICVICPMAIIIFYDIIASELENKKLNKDRENLEKELESLKNKK